MASPFGFSVGDFIAGIGLIHDIIEALKTSSTSTARYQGLISELFTLERALLEVKKLSFEDAQVTEANRLDVESLLDALQRTAVQCQSSIDKLLAKVKKYGGHLTINGSGSKWKDALRKVQWALLTDKDLEESRAEIRGHSSSINILLTIVQLKIIRLQSQNASDDQMRMVRWLQQGYVGTVSSLAGALTGIAHSSQKLLTTAKEIIGLNNQIFEKVVQIHQHVSLPRSLEYGEPVYFVDAFGLQTRFHLDFVYSPAVLEDWLKHRFRETGYEKILNKQFVLEDLKTRRQITFSREWQTQLYPGMLLGMDMIYERHPDELGTCPGCQRGYSGIAEEDIECSRCGVFFRRLNNVHKLSSDKSLIALHGTSKEILYPPSKSVRLQSGEEEIFNRRISDLELWVDRTNREKQHMQAFRRFRFQPTRSELDFAFMNPTVWRFSYNWGITEGSHTRARILGTYEEAENTFRQMQTRLETNQDSSNITRKTMLFALSNLGNVLCLYSQVDEAEIVFQRVLQEVTGCPEWNVQYIVLTNLAYVRWTQNRWREAETLLRQALAFLEEGMSRFELEFLDFHVGRLLLWNNIALVLAFQNRSREARDFQQQVIEGASTTFSADDQEFMDYRGAHRYIESIQCEGS